MSRSPMSALQRLIHALNSTNFGLYKITGRHNCMKCSHFGGLGLCHGVNMHVQTLGPTTELPSTIPYQWLKSLAARAKKTGSLSAASPLRYWTSIRPLFPPTWVTSLLTAAPRITSTVYWPTIRAACPTRSWQPRRVAARGFPRHSLGEDDVRMPRMAWHVLSRRSHETWVAC